MKELSFKRPKNEESTTKLKVDLLLREIEIRRKLIRPNVFNQRKDKVN